MSTIALPAQDNTTNDPRARAPLVNGSQDYVSITETVSRVVERKRPPTAWYVALRSRPV